MSNPKKSDLEFILNPPHSSIRRDGSTLRRFPVHSTPKAGVLLPRPNGLHLGSQAALYASPTGSCTTSTATVRDQSVASSARKMFRCPECSRAFKEKGNMNKHVLSVHEKKKTQVCQLCGKTFAFRDGLVRHISHVHQNERRYKCEICNHHFKQLSHLAKHHKTIHRNNY